MDAGGTDLGPEPRSPLTQPGVRFITRYFQVLILFIDSKSGNQT